ncbi:hypothetical protein KR215_002251, partial [Drosophila sulfurigaster]
SMQFLWLGICWFYLLMFIRALPLPNWNPDYLEDGLDFPDILDDWHYELMLKRNQKYAQLYM